MKALYFDCFSGAAGDMLLGALLDVGASENAVRSAIEGLHLQGLELEIAQVTKRSIRATRALVRTAPRAEGRTLAELTRVLERADLGSGVRERAVKTFGILAEAEARVHGTSISEMHLHEAGDDDALADVIGVCAALEDLDAEMLVCSPLPLGSGETQVNHGPLPVPAPAVLEILQGVPVLGKGDTELVTPTGAALLKANVDRFSLSPPMTLRATGYGAGERDLDSPNVLRVMLGDLLAGQSTVTSAWLVETNIDDMSPELFPYVIERLFEAGAQDAWVTPIVMKKGRPAFSLSVLCEGAERDRVLDVVYGETTTLGTRIAPVAKDELEREWSEVAVEGHPVRIKVARRGGQIVNAMPEHDDAAEVARSTGMPLKEVYRRAAEGAGSKDQ